MGRAWSASGKARLDDWIKGMNGSRVTIDDGEIGRVASHAGRLAGIFHHADPAERLARLRCLQTAVRLLTGPSGEPAVHALRTAERGGDLAAVESTLSAMPTITMRRILATYAATLPDVPT
jgi:hypothetical protein